MLRCDRQCGHVSKQEKKTQTVDKQLATIPKLQHNLTGGKLVGDLSLHSRMFAEDQFVHGMFGARQHFSRVTADLHFKP